MKQEEKTIKSKQIYDGRVIKVRVDEVIVPNGNRTSREIIEHSGGVVIIAITGDDKILLVEQFRKPVENNLLELPAGKLEPDEEPLECAKRELIEETGYEAGCIEYLFSFYTTPGYSNEKLYLYKAINLQEVGVDPDENEIIINHKITKNDIIKMIETGQIKDGKTIMGFMYYLAGNIDA